MGRALALCLMALAAGAAQAQEAPVPAGHTPAEPDVAAGPSSSAPTTSTMTALVDRGIALAGATPAQAERARLSVDMQLQPNDPTLAQQSAVQTPQGWIQAGHPAYGNNLGQSVRTRMWLQRGGVGLGWGTDAPLAGGENVRPVVAMRADLMPNTRVWVEQLGRPMAASQALPASPWGAGDSAVTRVGLDFKSPKRSSTLPLGVFRFQVSSVSTLTVRPRSGGMAFSYRSAF